MIANPYLTSIEFGDKTLSHKNKQNSGKLTGGIEITSFSETNYIAVDQCYHINWGTKSDTCLAPDFLGSISFDASDAT
jgi:hypothetical protein